MDRYTLYKMNHSRKIIRELYPTIVAMADLALCNQEITADAISNRQSVAALYRKHKCSDKFGILIANASWMAVVARFMSFEDATEDNVLRMSLGAYPELKQPMSAICLYIFKGGDERFSRLVDVDN